MQRRSVLRSLAPLAMLASGGVLLAGCGGGGAEASADPAPAPTPSPDPGPAPVARTVAYVANYESADISIYTVADTGSLSYVDTVPAGAGARAVGIHPSGRFAYAVNDTENTISIYTIDVETGRLTAAPMGSIAAGVEPNQIQIHPSGKFAYVPDYGSDGVLIFAIDTDTGAMGQPTSTSLGALPIVLATDPSGGFLFVALGDRRILSFAIDSTTGELSLRSTVTVGVNGLTGMAVAPSGSFLYVAADEDALYRCAIDALGGLGAPIYSAEARGVSSIAMDAAGVFICAKTGAVSQEISRYTVADSATGALAPAVITSLNAPGPHSSLAIGPSGRSVYAIFSNNDGALAGSVVAYTINDDGELKELTPSLATGIDPFGITVARLGG